MRGLMTSSLVFLAAVAVFLTAVWKGMAGTEQGSATESTAVAPASMEAGPARAEEGRRHGLDDEALRRRQRHEMHARAAEERFRRAVTLDGLRPEDVAPGVRALFATLRLEPVVKPGVSRPGYVEGLRITRLSPRNPLAEKGFREGDRLVRINGQALRDPAQIAHLMVRLRGGMEVCARRGQEEYCRPLTLSGSSTR